MEYTHHKSTNYKTMILVQKAKLEGIQDDLDGIDRKWRDMMDTRHTSILESLEGTHSTLEQLPYRTFQWL